MLRLCALLLAVVSLAAAGILRAAGEPPPEWAYNVAPVPKTPAWPAEDGTRYTLPGSSGKFTMTEIHYQFGPADWYPEDHPPMPDVVARGRLPTDHEGAKLGDVIACGLCHYPNGKGQPGNAKLAGLPASYFVQTMADYRSGARKGAHPGRAATNFMIAIAKAMTDEEVKAAAEYFGSMPWTPSLKVVETTTVPKTRVRNNHFFKLEGNETEPIGNRIVEIADDAWATEAIRDPRSGFTTYVPVGSIKKGEELVVNGGNGKTMECAACHGPDLKGIEPAPGLAGQWPSYTVRQLYDIKYGARKSELMEPVVAQLTNDDMLAIGAYTASLKP